ncbi:MAG: hypothetical protein ACLQMF_14310 [Rectinemataceae bacterium]
MDKFEKSSTAVIALFDKLVEAIDCEKRKMFGYPCAFINGNMFSGTFANRIFARIRVEDQGRWISKESRLKIFEPIKGRAMKEYLELGGSPGNIALLQEMIKESESYVRTLAIKAAKKKLSK